MNTHWVRGSAAIGHPTTCLLRGRLVKHPPPPGVETPASLSDQAGALCAKADEPYRPTPTAAHACTEGLAGVLLYIWASVYPVSGVRRCFRPSLCAVPSAGAWLHPAQS